MQRIRTRTVRRTVMLGLALCLALVSVAPALAQTAATAGTIMTVAGVTRITPAGFRGTETPLFFPHGPMGVPSLGIGSPGVAWHTPSKIGVDGGGAVYIADTLNNRILRLGIGPSGTTVDGTITLVAGTGARGFGGDGGRATAAQLNQPYAVKVAPDGSLLIADSGNRRIRRVGLDGNITTVAGNGQQLGPQGPAGNLGPATQARFNNPTSVDVGPDGSIYVVDTSQHQVRRVAPNGIIFAFAGTGEAGFTGEGEPARTAKFDGPSDVAVDHRTGNVYIADRNNHRVRMVQATTGNIFTIAGGLGAATPATLLDIDMGAAGGDPTRNFTGLATSVPGLPSGATVARFNRPSGLDIGPDGSIYVADQNSHLIRRLMPREVVRDVFGLSGDVPDVRIFNIIPVFRVMSVAGEVRPGGAAFTVRTAEGGFRTIQDPGAFYPGDLPDGQNIRSIDAPLRYPSSVAVAPDGTLHINDQGNLAIKRVTRPGPEGGAIAREAGAYHGLSGGPLSIQLLTPRTIAAAADGSFYIADTGSSVVRWVSADLSFSRTIAGTGITAAITIAGQIGTAATTTIGTVATQTTLAEPAGVAVHPNGDVYIADRGSSVVVRVDRQGNLFVVAGTGVPGFQGVAGAGTTEAKLGVQEQLNRPSGVAIAPNGDVYIADTDNHMIRRLNPQGQIFTVAGLGTAAYSGDDGPATGAELDHPTDVAVDAAGNVYIADRGNARVRRIDPAGIITTIAGTGANGFSGDGGPATSAMLNNPEGVTVHDATGTIYIADRDNHRVRRIGRDGVITTVAGTGTAGEAGEFGLNPTPAGTAQLRAPRGVSVAPNGVLFIADTDSAQIQRVTFGG